MSKFPTVPLTPAYGEIQCREWQDEDNARHVLVMASLRPHSFVMRGAGGRGFGDSKAAGNRFNAWRATTRDQLGVALKLARIAPFPKGAILGTVISGGMTKTLSVTGRGGERDVYGHDATNLTKAVEDLFTGLLYSSDRGNRFCISTWTDRDADWFSLATWEATPTGLRIQAAWMNDEAWTGPTRAEWLERRARQG